MTTIGILFACAGIAWSLTTIVLCITRLLDRNNRWNI